MISKVIGVGGGGELVLVSNSKASHAFSTYYSAIDSARDFLCVYLQVYCSASLCFLSVLPCFLGVIAKATKRKWRTHAFKSWKNTPWTGYGLLQDETTQIPRLGIKVSDTNLNTKPHLERTTTIARPIFRRYARRNEIPTCNIPTNLILALYLSRNRCYWLAFMTYGFWEHEVGLILRPYLGTSTEGCCTGGQLCWLAKDKRRPTVKKGCPGLSVSGRNKFKCQIFPSRHFLERVWICVCVFLCCMKCTVHSPYFTR